MIHDQKIKQFRRKRSDNVQSKSKLFFEEYSYEIFDRIRPNGMEPIIKLVIK